MCLLRVPGSPWSASDNRAHRQQQTAATASPSEATSFEMVYEWPPRDLFNLSRNCPYCQLSLTSVILSHIRLGSFPAGGENLQAHIAAGFGPFIVLLGQH